MIYQRAAIQSALKFFSFICKYAVMFEEYELRLLLTLLNVSLSKGGKLVFLTKFEDLVISGMYKEEGILNTFEKLQCRGVLTHCSLKSTYGLFIHVELKIPVTINIETPIIVELIGTNGTSDKEVVMFALTYESLRKEFVNSRYQVFNKQLPANQQKSWLPFKKGLETCKSLDASPEDFLRAQFIGMSTWGKCPYPRPTQLSTTGAVDRYHTWEVQRRKVAGDKYLEKGKGWIAEREQQLRERFSPT